MTLDGRLRVVARVPGGLKLHDIARSGGVLLTRESPRVGIPGVLQGDNTLTRVRARNRGYPPNQDPTDPAGGTLGPINSTTLVYKRLAASDADLLLP